MSLRSTVRAVPAMMKVGFAEAVAYRAEMIVWVLATTMPLVMMALWTAVAREAPVGRFGQADFVAYFLSTFIVRQMTGSWAAWEINYEVRTGALSRRLLQPVEPVVRYAIENLAALPMRLIVGIPVALIILLTVGHQYLSHDWVIWGVWVFAMLGSWILTFLINIAIGALSLFMESSIKIMEVYFTVFAVLSGYLIPVELFPDALRNVVDVLPFRFQIGFPVELMTRAHGRGEALELLAAQWGFVALFLASALLLWKYGLRRYAAYGG